MILARILECEPEEMPELEFRLVRKVAQAVLECSAVTEVFA
jgi:hypothetical protein